MPDTNEFGEGRLRGIVEQCLRLALGTEAPLPADDEDWVGGGALDSMAHVDVLLCIGKAIGLPDFPGRIEGRPPSSTKSVLHALRKVSPRILEPLQAQGREPAGSPAALAGVVGWGAAIGSVRVEAATVEREYSLPAGTLTKHAGIESVVRVSPQEDEVSLAFDACQTALRTATLDVGDVDWIVVTGETFFGFPSLGSLLHSRLLARDTCGVLDVGGACVGLLNGLCVGRSLLASGMAERVLIATSDVHSRHLTPGRVDGGFGGLFGDGSSAFVLNRIEETVKTPPYRLGHFQFGCAGTFSSALTVGLNSDGKLAVRFEGQALARAAVVRLERILADLELRTGLSRGAASGFATHQPNARLVEVLARQAGLDLQKFPVVSKSYGNLGSSTCGVALAKVLDEHGHRPADKRGPIFLAAVGPGMLWGGGVLR